MFLARHSSEFRSPASEIPASERNHTVMLMLWYSRSFPFRNC